MSFSINKSVEQFIPDGYEQTFRCVLKRTSISDEELDIKWHMTHFYPHGDEGERDKVVYICIFDNPSEDGSDHGDAIVFCSLAELKAVKNFLDCLRNNV